MPPVLLPLAGLHETVPRLKHSSITPLLPPATPPVRPLAGGGSQRAVVSASAQLDVAVADVARDTAGIADERNIAVIVALRNDGRPLLAAAGHIADHAADVVDQRIACAVNHDFAVVHALVDRYVRAADLTDHAAAVARAVGSGGDRHPHMSVVPAVRNDGIARHVRRDTADEAGRRRNVEPCVGVVVRRRRTGALDRDVPERRCDGRGVVPSSEAATPPT